MNPRSVGGVDRFGAERYVGLSAQEMHDRGHGCGVFGKFLTSRKLEQHDLGVIIVVQGAAEDAFFWRVLKRFDVCDVRVVHVESSSVTSKEQFKEVVDPAGEDEFLAGVFHHFLDLLAIGRMVAMLGAMLTSGLGIERAGRSLDERVRQEFLAFVAEANFLAHERRDVMGFDLYRRSGHIGVLVTAIDVDEISQQPQITVQRFVY